MTTERHIKITESGGCFLVTHTEEERDMNDTVISIIGAGVQTMLPKAFIRYLPKKDETPTEPSYYGNCHMLISQEATYVGMRIPFLRLNSQFKLRENGLLTPEFHELNDHNPVLRLEWVPPEGMGLFLFCKVEYGSRQWQVYADQHTSLFAFDDERHIFVLPLPNLFDDGHVCMGEYEPESNSIPEAFDKAIEQFMKSEWNSDLFNETKQQRANLMFKFKPDNNGFEQVHEVPDWPTLCEKIATPETNMAIKMINIV